MLQRADNLEDRFTHRKLSYGVLLSTLVFSSLRFRRGQRAGLDSFGLTVLWEISSLVYGEFPQVKINSWSYPNLKITLLLTLTLSVDIGSKCLDS